MSVCCRGVKNHGVRIKEWGRGWNTKRTNSKLFPKSPPTKSSCLAPSACFLPETSLSVVSTPFPLSPSHSLHAHHLCQTPWCSWCYPSLDGCSAVNNTSQAQTYCPCNLSWAGKSELLHCKGLWPPMGSRSISLRAVCRQGGGSPGSSAFWQAEVITLVVPGACICKLLVHEQHICY